MAKFSITGTNGHQVKPAAEMSSAYGIAWDALQNCFWVSMAGVAGASPIWKLNPDYTIADSFLQPGFDMAGGCEMWRDTFLLVLEQGTPDAIWCLKFAPPLDHDVGVLSIVAPPASMNRDSVNPIAQIRNFGANPESNIPVTCWIDSLGTRVYTGTDTLAGPLAAGATAVDTFPMKWTTGPSGAHYTVTVFTELASDMNLDNDTVYRNTTITGPGVQESPEPMFALYKVSPSFVRGQALISYYVAGCSDVNLNVYDVTGKLVRTLVEGTVEAGSQTVTWNRTDNGGGRVANGTYFYRLAVDGKSVSGKAIVLK
jgi:hypothetical protein